MVKILLSKKGISGVITVVLMIALVMAAAAIVWGIVKSPLKGQVEGAKSCFGNFDKVTINPIYTCYDSTADTVQFSLSIGDIEVDEVLVSIASAGDIDPYTLITDDTGVIVSNDFGSGLANYNSADDPQTGFGTDLIKLPEENAGLTYVASGFSTEPDLIQIAPVIDGQQCEVSDTISGIESCLLS